MTSFMLLASLFSFQFLNIHIDDQFIVSNEVVEVYEIEWNGQNDEYSSAECLYEDSISSDIGNTIILHGNIDSYYSCDADYYCFSVLNDTTCQFNISSLGVWNEIGIVLSEVKYNNNYTNYLDDIKNTHTVNKSCLFSKQLKCGTYYFYIYDYNNSINTNYDYTVQINLTDHNDYLDYNILDIKNNKITTTGQHPGAAIWLSDFIPFSELNVWFNSTQIDFYYNQNYNDLVFNYYQTLSNNGDIHLASYYIWSPILKSLINISLDTIKDEMLDYEENETLIIERIEYTRSATQLVFTVISSGASLITSFPINIVGTVFSLVGPSVIDWLFDMLLPKSTINWGAYKAFLSNMIEKTSFRLIDDYPIYDNDDVIEIPIYYSISNNITLFPNNYHYNFDYSKTYYHFYENVGTNYIDYQSNATSSLYPYDKGRTYYFLDSDILLSSASFSDCSELIDEIRTPEQIFLNTPNSKSYISVGNYCWMEFTAPSTGEYYFSFHYGQYYNQYINGSNIIVDVFSSVVSGYSFNNYIQSYSMGYLLNNGITTGVYFHKTLNAQENIFLRVRGNNWCGLFPSITYMISDYEISEVVHVHQLDIYEWISTLSHYNECSCGYYVIEPHIVPSNAFSHGERFATCLLCGGIAERGFVNYMFNDGTILYVVSLIDENHIVYFFDKKELLI